MPLFHGGAPLRHQRNISSVCPCFTASNRGFRFFWLTASDRRGMVFWATSFLRDSFSLLNSLLVSSSLSTMSASHCSLDLTLLRFHHACPFSTSLPKDCMAIRLRDSRAASLSSFVGSGPTS